MLLEARRLLLAPPERPIAVIAVIAVIAASLGSEDPHHFSRFFTRRAGVAPSPNRALAAKGLSALPDPLP